MAGQPGPQIVEVDDPVLLAANEFQRTRPEPEQPQRPVDRGVPFVAGENPDAGSSGQTVLLDVPARVRQTW